MNKTKLFQVLSTLNDNEWKSLIKYIKMCHDVESDNYRLIVVLKKLFSKRMEVEPLLVKQSHFDVLTPKGFSNLLSRVYAVVQDWLVYYDGQAPSYDKQINLIKAYNKRGVYSIANKLYQRLEADLTNQDTIDINYNKHLHKLYHIQYYSDNPIKYVEGGPLLEKLITSYSDNVIDQSTLYEVELFNWGNLQHFDFSKQITKIKKLGSVLGKSTHSDLIKLVVEIAENGCLNSLHKVSTLLFNKKILIPSEFHTLLASYCLNYALRYYRAGRIDDVLISQLYDHCLETSVLLHRGKIPEGRFLNMIGTLGTFRSYQEINSFIETWISYVDTHHKEELLYLGKAENSFHHEKYAEIIPLLRTVNFKQVNLRLRAMCLECAAIYLDKDMNDLLLMKIHNLKRYLKRYNQKLTNSTYKSFQNFVLIIRLLQKSKYNEVKIDLSKYEYLMYRSWVNKQID